MVKGLWSFIASRGGPHLFSTKPRPTHGGSEGRRPHGRARLGLPLALITPAVSALLAYRLLDFEPLKVVRVEYAGRLVKGERQAPTITV
ncbi:MAG: hypothetical protein ABWK01_00040 [Infirmifilum sp.]